ncbi:AMP-binding protein [Actinomadura vinacea]|uniref:AMP-binding protein n=1 Tax=Actinomadura vinacea TaxID=115336 RepID=A0ABN3IEE9_9ACTN
MPQRLLSGRGFYLGLMFQRAAAAHGDVAITLDRPLDAAMDAGTSLTYRAAARLVDDLAARLWAAGVRPSEHVAIHKTDNFDIVLVACAASRIGAVPALLSPALDGSATAALLGRLHAPWLVTDRATLNGPLAGTGAADLARRIITVDGGGTVNGNVNGNVNGAAAGPIDLAAFAGAPARPPVRLHPRDPALITHSSGTTGVPKLAVHCPETMWNRLVPQQLMGWPTRGETAALCMSFVHSRFYHLLGVLLGFGSPLLLLVDPAPAAVGPLLVRHRPGIVETHPNTFVLWEELATAPGTPLARVRSYGSTFDAIHPRTIRRLLGASRRRAPWLLQLYGQSETGPVAFRWYSRRGATRSNGRLVGTRIPGFTRLRVVDDHGVPCPAGVPGHIEARTRGRILAYHGAPEQYARQTNGAWWRMGDMGYRNRWGALYLIDREIDQIDSVDSSLHVEDVLMSRLEELREVVIVSGPEREAVPVVCTRDDRPLDLSRWERATADLPPMADPRRWRFDDLPRTGTWKIKRVELIRLLAEDAVPAVPGA